MNRFSLTLLSAALSALALVACGGGQDDPPPCDRPFVGPLPGPDQSAQAHCLVPAPGSQP